MAPLTFFEISPSSGVPIYRQLVDQVERLVRGGRLEPGDGLPSVREVAQGLQINPMTVSKAYSLLEAQGWLERLRGRGMVVSERPGTTDSGDPAAALRPTIEELLAQARQMRIDLDELLQFVRQVAGETDD